MDNSVLPQQADANGAEPLRCIVIDDEPIALRGMALLAARHPALRLEGAFTSPLEAMEWMERNQTDLVLLDIEMPGIRGIDLAARLSDHALVVFTTAYSEYAATSYDFDAVDYLLKPINAARFDRAVSKALQRMAILRQQGPKPAFPTITLRADRRFVNIDPATIIYIEGLKDYVKVHTDSGHILSRITIKSLLDRLPADRFLRIHKSYVVNARRVAAYDNSHITLHSPTPGSAPVTLPVGSAYRTALRQALPDKR